MEARTTTPQSNRKAVTGRSILPLCSSSLFLSLILSCYLFHQVEGVSRCNQGLVASASISRFAGSYGYQQSHLVAATRRISRPEDACFGRLQRTIPGSSRKPKRKKVDKIEVEALDPSADPFAEPMTTQEIYNSLGPIGKTVAGTVEIAVSTCTEYLTGFLGGFFIGYVTDFPRFMFKNVEEAGMLPIAQELSRRFQRMNAKSFRWAKSWGGISAAFAGFRVATRVVRGGREDEWNTVFSTAAAGAFFARKGKL
jgi:Tim17/Tim22/Tim23/Pmp24 family